MHLLSDPLFQAIFNSPVPRIIVKADAPLFTIVANNDAHKVATNLVAIDICGKSVWEVFKPDQSGGNGGELISSALTQAQNTNKTCLIPPFRYDMLTSDQVNLEVKWWQFEIMPIGGNGKPEFLLTTTHDITEQVIKNQTQEESQQKERTLNDELAAVNEELSTIVEELRASQEELKHLNETLEEKVAQRTLALTISESKFRSLIEQAPVAIAYLKGKNHVVDAANQEMLKLWGKGKEITGKPIIKAFPEMERQIYPQILHDVLKSGLPYYGNEFEVKLNRNNTNEIGYYNFINYPLKDENGLYDSIIVVANEVTQQVLSRRRIEQSESNLHTLIMKARYPLMILRGLDWVVEIANHGISELWAKPLSEITGRKLLDIFPNLYTQPFPDLLKTVFDTGESYRQEEDTFWVETAEGPITKYISFFYDPIIEEDKSVSGIIVTAHDITESVNTRKELERAYEQAKLSKQAAKLGLFDMDLIAGTMEWDTRCRELFGISHQNTVTYEDDFLPGLHDEDRDRISDIISKLFDREISKGDYDVEYRTISQNSGRMRWVRAKGKVFFSEGGKPLRFIGSVIDITGQKREEQRKNDFIGMVSHELKTPLTSIKAYTQMLRVKLKTQNDKFALPALLQTEKQVKKMTNMINGFLNLSRLESGNLHLKKTKFDLNSLIQEVIDDLKLTNTSHIFSFRNTDAAHVFADEEKIEHVISNIISNAIKYSEEGTIIQIKTELNKGNAVVSVADSGIGIDEIHLEKLFGRFYRVEEVNTKYISGFGIGLYLSAEIIKLHKGKIWVESKDGEGSIFYFSIPVKIS